MPKRAQMQTFQQMIDENTAKKGNRLYRQESGEYNDQRISDLVRATAEELAAAVEDTGPISLSDTAELQRRTIIYLRACEQAATIPTFSGFARRLGVTD